MAFNRRFSGGTAGLWGGAFVGVEEEKGFGLGMPSARGQKTGRSGLESQQEGSKDGAKRVKTFAEMVKNLKEKEEAGEWKKVGGGKGKAVSAGDRGTQGGTGVWVVGTDGV